MKLEHKLVIPFVVFIVSLIILSLVFYDFTRITRDNFENVLSVDSRFNDFGNALIQLNWFREAQFVKYVETKDPLYDKRYLDTVKETNSVYGVVLDSDVKSKLHQAYAEQYSTFMNLTRIELKIMYGEADALVTYQEEYGKLRLEYDRQLRFPISTFQQYAKRDLEENLQKSRFYEVLLIVIFIVTAALVAVEFLIIKRDIINPIHRMSEGLERIRSKEFQARLGGDDKSEMGKLMREIDVTASEMGTHNAHQEQRIRDRENMAKLATALIAERDKKLAEKENEAELAMLVVDEEEKRDKQSKQTSRKHNKKNPSKTK